jgi:hypothetical protein
MNTTLQSSGGRRFYTLVALTMATFVLTGFARTYYLRAWFDVPPLSWRLHLHGLVLTLWVGLFVVQTRLIAVGQRRLHMRLGIAGVALAAVAVVTIYAAALEAVRLGADRGGIGIDRLYSNVLLMTFFGSFVALGAAFRKRPDTHKAFMLLAMIAALGPALTRTFIVVLGLKIRDPHLPVESALVLAALIYIWQKRRRLDWVLLVGGALLITTQATRRLVGGSEAWAQIGNWLVQ